MREGKKLEFYRALGGSIVIHTPLGIHDKVGPLSVSQQEDTAQHSTVFCSGIYGFIGYWGRVAMRTSSRHD